MEQFEAIRRDSRDREMSVRALAKRHGVHRRTVRQALADATPPTRTVPERSAPATGPYVDLVRWWLIEDLSAPRKQRHTARRIWQRLVEEEEARIGESTVRNLVARLRTEIGAIFVRALLSATSRKLSGIAAAKLSAAAKAELFSAAEIEVDEILERGQELERFRGK